MTIRPASDGHNAQSMLNLAHKSNSFAAPAPLSPIANRISQLVFRPAEILRLFAKRSAQSEAIDHATLDSVYRLARLLAANDDMALDLVKNTYRKAANSGRLSGLDQRQLRRNLYKSLYRIFGQDSGKYQRAEKESEDRTGNASVPISVRKLIRKQNPIARFIIFLHDCEDLSLDEVVSITGCSRAVVQKQLVEFRCQLRQLLGDTASRPLVSASR